MTFSEPQSAQQETALGAALSAAGVSSDAGRLQAIIVAVNGNPSALWLKLKDDKALARIAMHALMAWADAGLGLRDEASNPSASAIRQGVAEHINRAARREQASKSKQEQRAFVEATAKEYAKAAEKKVIQRALGTFRLSDGSLLCNRHWYELLYIARNSEREAKLVRAVIAAGGQVTDDKARVTDIISAGKFDTILEQIGSV